MSKSQKDISKVVVLCPESHVIATYKPEDWAHSSAEASMHVAVTCYGNS